MYKGKRAAALFLALVMVFAAAFATAPVPVSAAKKVTVKSVVTKSSLSGNKKTLYVAKGKTVKLSTTVTVTPNKAANKKVTYKSANKKIATVTAKGVVKGVKAGSTKITVTSKKNTKKKATIKVKVTKYPVTKVKMSQSSAALEKGAGLALKATVTAKKGAVKTVAWKSSNEKVATVSSKGAVTAVGAGTATITAQAIDGSGKKATCKVTVTDSVSLTGMNILNSYTISFSLNKAYALSANQVSVLVKRYANGTYKGNMKVESLSTNDRVNYTMILENNISIGSYVSLTIPVLTGVKSLEKQYMEAVCNFIEDSVYSGKVGGGFSTYLYFDEGYGYSQFSINKLPAGLKAETGASYLYISGIPTAAGITTAVFSAVDEFGNTLTRNVTFVIGSDTVLAGAAAPQYALASDDNRVGVYPTVAGGSGNYNYQIVSGQSTGVQVDSDGEVHGSFKIAGNYTVTVRVTDANNANLRCDIPVVFSVAQGISIGGCVKDAQGNPMGGASVSFTNKNRADRYCSYKYVYSNSETGTYTAVVAAGTYDIQVSRSYESDAASGSYYASNQALTTTRTGYDFTLPLYKVALTSNDESLYRYWYVNNEEVGYGSTLYLKPGSYKLETNEFTDSTEYTTQGDWFNGTTQTATGSDVKLTASVNVVNAAVQAAVSKVAVGNASVRTTTYPAAKNTSSYLLIDEGYYSLPWEEVISSANSYYGDVQIALLVDVENAGKYVLGSSEGYVNLYDSNGTQITPDDSDYDTKTYNNLPAGTYYIGTGDYGLEDYSVYMETAASEEEVPVE